MGEQRLEVSQAQLEFRGLREQDLEQACGLSRNEGWPHRLEDWRFMLSLGEGRVVVSGNRLVATAMA